jgi:transcriptional regulator with XRE-family HTH domain
MTKAQLLERLGLTQAQLARELGISRAAVAQWKADEPVPERQLLRLRHEIFPERFAGDVGIVNGHDSEAAA